MALNHAVMQSGARTDQYFVGLNAWDDHMFVDEELVNKYRQDSRLPNTKTLAELMPDVYRKDFADQEITVDPMKYDRWINDSQGLRIHHDARQRKRDFNHEGVKRAQSIYQDPVSKPLYEPTVGKLNNSRHWTSDAARLQSDRGAKRDLSQDGVAPRLWRLIYDGLQPNKTTAQIEREIRVRGILDGERLFDCSGSCR